MPGRLAAAYGPVMLTISLPDEHHRIRFMIQCLPYHLQYADIHVFKAPLSCHNAAL